MPIKVLMPSLSPTMTVGNLTKWVKNEGDKIKPGEVIAEIETDKATMEVESVEDGILAKVIINAGTQNVPVGSLIAVILEAGEDDASLKDFLATQASSPTIASTAATSTPVVEKVHITAPEVRSTDTRIFASPLARRIATDKGVNLSSIQGSGPHGRIVKSDVENLSPSGHTRPIGRNRKEYIIEPHSNMRKVIATRLVESKQNVPHFYLNIECTLDRLLEMRADINEAGKYKVSVNDLIIKASALAMHEVPGANASWSDDGIILYNNIDISVAVAIDGGLITPVIRNADQKSIVELSNEMKALAARAREGKLKPEEFQGGGFTISNLGMYGIRRFNAIINPPQSCILAVGEGVKRAVVEDDQIKIRTIVDVTLSCDHRVVDGAIGAQFLKSFKDCIEKPVKMVM